MLKKRVIPVVQLMGNTVVKTVNFMNSRQAGDATATVKVFSARSADELVLIDIEASKNSKQPNFEFIEFAAKNCFMPLTIGGGIDSFDTAKKIFSAGADKVLIGSLLHEKPAEVEKIAAHYGQQAVVAAIDCKKNEADYITYSSSGTMKSVPLERHFSNAVDCGAGEILLTSIDKEGLMQGFDLELIQNSVELSSLPIVVNGGAGIAQDFVECMKFDVSGVAASSVFLWEGLTIKDIKSALKQINIPLTSF